ncbi:hypothetical protein [Criblamydia sequanensis]|uniref:Conserved putative membrane protein n=1 Tax=Candidatus Criblamydia sequanensis CRIB-18 TaxID=1437425 RepID=A0A090CZG1_9BACT|nr:hypothetical protein [Criblamydia sequanensis]CDR34477.1 Conserved putative membrane protein [Criblamydia sequanensis CRIB-18]
MVASRVEGEDLFFINKEIYHEELNKVIQSVLPKFDRIAKNFFLINLCFWLLIGVEISVLLIFFSWFLKSSLVALGISAVFLTIFTYFILRMYFISKKPEQYEDFLERYTRGAKSVIKYRDGIPEHHFALAASYSKLASALHDREYTFFKPPFGLYAISPTLEKISCSSFWRDFHCMKELLLKSCIEEHHKVVQCEPTSLEVHAALANAYVQLSTLYVDPRKTETFDEDRWIPSNKFDDEQKEKFQYAALKAVEEFKILNHFAPNDPWIHSQLAYSYHDLEMPEEEIKEYEAILKLRPDDKETQFKLGKLYFSQGYAAKGLRIYEDLRRTNFKKAEELLESYGNNLQF